jgi:citrate lyase subunit beta/citryl-CoA lyase
MGNELIQGRPIRSERTSLFVPAARWDMIEKGSTSAADAVCLDLEDGVAPDRKALGRINVVKALRELDFGPRTRMVRVNGVDTQHTYRDLVEVIEGAGDRLDVVMVPKAQSPADLLFVDRLLTQIELAKGFRSRIGIAAQIETAAGLLWIREIAAATPRLESLIFGPGDFAASMGMPTSGIGAFDEHDEQYPGHRWHTAMQMLVAAARAHGLRAIDGPFAAYQDAAGLDRSARIGRALGFDGKQAIHPGQLDAINRIYSPTEAEVAHAARVVEVCDAAAAEGRGTAGLDGTMIDLASVRIARVILERHRRLTSNR